MDTATCSVHLNPPNANTLYPFLHDCLHNYFEPHPSHLLTDRSSSRSAVKARNKKRTALHKVAPVDIEINLVY
jgi:hypothetical protein